MIQTVDVVASWYGMREETGNNDGEFVERVLGLMEYRDFSQLEWCAATIISANLIANREGGEPLLPGSRSRKTRWGMRDVDRMVIEFKKARRWFQPGVLPERNDLVFFGKDDGIGRSAYSHVAIVETVGADSIGIVEGNFSNKVNRRPIKFNDPRVAGYGRIA